MKTKARIDGLNITLKMYTLCRLLKMCYHFKSLFSDFLVAERLYITNLHMRI